MTRREELITSLIDYGVPEHLHEGIVAYVTKGIPNGDFLKACFANDFVDAVCRAGAGIGIDGLVAIAKWIYGEAPQRSWGSPGIVKTWKGLE